MDSSVYGALVRLSQWWKMRYPLIDFEGNGGNIIGDGAAAQRYTNCRLSKFGELVLEDIEKDCVRWRPNYDNSLQEPMQLPSKFPNLLCNGNSGIAVGISSSILPHNYNEVAEAIKYYIDNNTCNTADLLRFIKGPDFPTGGKIINGEEILNIYETGNGVVKVRANYRIEQINGETKIIFTDIPYGTEIQNGVITPIKKLLNEEGYTEFKNVNHQFFDADRNFEIYVTLSKGANIDKVLNLLFTKTKLQQSIKINNTLIVNNNPKLCNLKEMIKYYVNHRSDIIKSIARNDFEKTNHKLTVNIGLQKCLSNIDLLISLIKNADNRAAAKTAIRQQFSLTEEQADAVLDMKLVKLSRLDIHELEDELEKLKQEVAKQKEIIENEQTRFNIIKEQLDEMKKYCVDDKRLTQIEENKENEPIDKMIDKLIYITSNGIEEEINNSTIQVIKGKTSKELSFYDSNGNFMPLKNCENAIGAFRTQSNKKYIICVTKNGYVKMTNKLDYSFNKTTKGLKLKDNDELIYAGDFDNTDYLFIYDGNNAMKIPFKDFSISGKLTQGVKSGLVNIKFASVVNNGDELLFINENNKAKITLMQEFNENSRTSKGTEIGNFKFIKLVTDRNNVILVPNSGKNIILDKNKVPVKNKNSIGNNLPTVKTIEKII